MLQQSRASAAPRLKAPLPAPEADGCPVLPFSPRLRSAFRPALRLTAVGGGQTLDPGLFLQGLLRLWKPAFLQQLQKSAGKTIPPHDTSIPCCLISRAQRRGYTTYPMFMNSYGSAHTEHRHS